MPSPGKDGKRFKQPAGQTRYDVVVHKGTRVTQVTSGRRVPLPALYRGQAWARLDGTEFEFFWWEDAALGLVTVHKDKVSRWKRVPKAEGEGRFDARGYARDFWARRVFKDVYVPTKLRARGRGVWGDSPGDWKRKERLK